MGSMLASGLSLGRALDVSQRQAGNAKLEQVLSQVAEDVRHGSPLNEAMAKYPSVFSKLFVAMVRAGEESGNLSGSLAVVGEQMERAYALKKSAIIVFRVCLLRLWRFRGFKIAHAVVVRRTRKAVC
jgi:type IV pilus assembly protein PilC